MVNACETWSGADMYSRCEATSRQLGKNRNEVVNQIQARLGHESLATTSRYLAALKRAENPHAAKVADLLRSKREPARRR